MREVSVRERYYKKLFIWLVKRETGVNPVRTRHRILRALNPTCHWETGKADFIATEQ